jgi:hypothetical protein
MSVDDLEGVRNAEGKHIEIKDGAVVVGGDGEGGVAVKRDDPHLLVVAGPGDGPVVGEVPVSVHLEPGSHSLGDALEPLTVAAERVGHGRGEDRLKVGIRQGNLGLNVMGEEDVHPPALAAAGDVLVGDRLLRPPAPPGEAITDIDRAGAPASEEGPTSPLPAIAAGEVGDVVPNRPSALGEGQSKELVEVLVVAVDEPDGNASSLGLAAQGVEVPLTAGSRPDTEVTELEHQLAPVALRLRKDVTDHPFGVAVHVPGEEDSLQSSH